jgi:hypothetical protein
MGVTEAAGQRHDKGTKASEHGARLVPSSTSPAAGNLFAWLWLPKMLPNRVSVYHGNLLALQKVALFVSHETVFPFTTL